MSDEYFSNISSIILKFCNFYHKRILSNIVEGEEYIDEPKRFIYTVCRKTCDVTEALNIFVRNYNTHFHYQISTIILLRSILSDIIISESIIILGRNESELKDLVNKIYLDHIDKTYTSIDNLYKIVNDWDSETVDKMKIDFRNVKSNYFDNNGKMIGTPLRTSPEKLLKRVFAEKPKKSDYELLKLAFHYYDIFSKYEHLGDLSFYLIHRVYDTKEDKKRWFEIYQSLELIMTVLINYTNCWDGKFQTERKELNLILKEYIKMKPE